MDELTDSDTIAVITVLADQNHYHIEQFLHPDLQLETYDAIGSNVQSVAEYFAVDVLLLCDVWENEPVFYDGILHQAFLATPHSACNSVEAKSRAFSGTIENRITACAITPGMRLLLK